MFKLVHILEPDSFLEIKDKELVFITYSKGNYYVINTQKPVPEIPEVYIIPEDQIEYISMKKITNTVLKNNMTFFKDFKDQSLLFPPKIRDLIPKNHICHLLDKIIQNMDLNDIEKRYEGAGHPAYHPKIILKLLILGQIDGIRSSRKIAKNARENVVYMYLAGLLISGSYMHWWDKDKSQCIKLQCRYKRRFFYNVTADYERIFEFHSTIAMKLSYNKFSKVKNYIKSKPGLNFEHVVVRATLLKGGFILQEYDFLLRKPLTRNLAKNKQIYSKTI